MSPLQAVEHYLSSVGWLSAIGFLCTASWGVFRVAVLVGRFVSQVQSDWESTRNTIAASKQLLDTVATNHLAHIQESSERTARAVELQGFSFSKINDNLQANTATLEGVKSFLEAQALYGRKQDN